MTKILHADNNADFLESVDWFLREEGYEVIQALSPEEAQEKFDTEHPDIAVFDLRMVDDSDDKDISGLTLAKRLPSIPIIMLSSAHAPLQLPIHVSWIRKSEGPVALLEKIKEVLK